MSRVRLVLYLFLVATLVSSCDRVAEEEISSVIITGDTMGTYYRVTVPRLPVSISEPDLVRTVEADLNRISQLMSTYLPDSEVSQFNRSISIDWFGVSKETALVISRALEIHTVSDGAFDITVSPLVDLWGFGGKQRRIAPPPHEQIKAALRHTGSHHLEARLDPPEIRKAIPELRIDLSAIAKGYAVDQLANHLRQLGIENCLVDIGGEIRAVGSKAEGQPWVVAIQSPTTSESSPLKTLRLEDRALATSGDYRNYFEFEGKRFSHEIDPRTGYPVEHSLVSASVVSEDCMTADAWATALMIPGPETSAQLARQAGLPALLIVKGESTFIEIESPLFTREFTSQTSP